VPLEWVSTATFSSSSLTACSMQSRVESSKSGWFRRNQMS
jgi:hypothetical protein